jgi:hypothetical protein
MNHVQRPLAETGASDLGMLAVLRDPNSRRNDCVSPDRQSLPDIPMSRETLSVPTASTHSTSRGPRRRNFVIFCFVFTATASAASQPRLRERSPESWWSKSATTGSTNSSPTCWYYVSRVCTSRPNRSRNPPLHPMPRKCVCDSPVTTDRASSMRSPQRSANSESASRVSRLGTVTDLPGKDGGRQFEITAQLTVPAGTDLDAVLDSIGALAVSLDKGGAVRATRIAVTKRDEFIPCSSGQA